MRLSPRRTVLPVSSRRITRLCHPATSGAPGADAAGRGVTFFPATCRRRRRGLTPVLSVTSAAVRMRPSEDFHHRRQPCQAQQPFHSGVHGKPRRLMGGAKARQFPQMRRSQAPAISRPPLCRRRGSGHRRVRAVGDGLSKGPQRLRRGSGVAWAWVSVRRLTNSSIAAGGEWLLRPPRRTTQRSDLAVLAKSMFTASRLLPHAEVDGVDLPGLARVTVAISAGAGDGSDGA